MTQRQRRATQILVENGGKSASKAMIKAGYSPATAKNPSKLTQSKSFRELVDDILPDTLLLRRHQELLNAAVKVKTIKNGKISHVEERMDVSAIRSGLELGYRIKGHYAATKDSQPFKTGFEDLSDEELDRALEDKKFLMDRYRKYKNDVV